MEIDSSLAKVNKLIIVSVRGRIVGLCVDKVLGELRVPQDAVRPAPSMLHSGHGQENSEEFFSGVCKVGSSVVFLINLEGLTALSSAER